MKRLLKYVFLGILGLLLLVAVAVGVIGFTPVGERFVTAQVNSFLKKKIKTPFRIGRIKYRLPDWVLLEDVYVQTPKGDTLLSGGLMRVDVDMLDFLRNRVTINQVELARMRVNLRRTLPDTTFNFQFLIDAFAAGEPGAKPKTKAVDTTAAPLDINLTGLGLNDVRITYRDDVVGADVNAAVDTLGLRFAEANVNRSRYHVDSVFLSGLTARARIYEGLPTPPSASSSDTLDLRIGTWHVRRTQWDVAVETADFKTQGRVPHLDLVGRQLYLNAQQVALDTVNLRNADLAFVMGEMAGGMGQGAGGKMQGAGSGGRGAKPAVSTNSKTPKPVPAKATEKRNAARQKLESGSSPAENSPGWLATLSQIFLENNRIRFDDATQPRQPKGLDYAHLDLRGLGIRGEAISYQPDRIAAQVRQGAFRASSGLTLRRLDADVVYTDRQAAVTNLLVQTPQTLLRDALVLRYDSLGQLTRPAEAGRVTVGLNLRQSQLAVADVLQLVPALANTPPFAGNETGIIRANTRITGTLAALNIPTFELAMLSGTRLKASGKLTNVTDVDRLGLDLTIREAVTRKTDLVKLVPKGSLPSTVDLPSDLRLTGRVRGQVNNLNLDLNLRSPWGAAAFDGALKNFVSGKNQSYAGTARLTGFDAGKWLKQPQQLGKITATATVNGRGLDVKTMQTDFRLAVAEATLNGYRYQNFAATGTLAGGTLDVKGGIDDPNARVRLDTRLGLLGEFPSVTGDVAIRELDLRKLGLYQDSLQLRGDIGLAMQSTDPTRPVGTVVAQNAVVTLNGKTYPVDSLYLKADARDGRKQVVAEVPFAQLSLTGQFEYTRLSDIVASEVRRYFDVPQLQFKQVPPPYDFDIRAKAYHHPLLQAFVPNLTRLDTVRLAASLDNTRDTTLAATLTTGVIEYDTTTVTASNFSLRAVNNQLFVNGRVAPIRTKSLRIGPTELTGLAAENRFRFNIANKDSVNENRYAMAGVLSVLGENYRLQLDREGLMTNYRGWLADTAGFVQYGPGGIQAERFTLRLQADPETENRVGGAQVVTLNSTEARPGGPLEVILQNLHLSELADLAGQDTTLASGTLNGTVLLRNVTSNLSFIGQIAATDLRVMRQPLGTLEGTFYDEGNGRVSVDAALVGEFNDARITGSYNSASAAAPLDVDIDLKRLDARTVEAFSFGQLREARGKLTGRIKASGATSRPDFNGTLAFDSVAFTVAQNNARYRIDQERLRFEGATVTFADFNVRDTLGRALTVNGTVNAANLPDVRYDLRVTAENFMVLNATRRDNDYAYGDAAVTANLRIRGVGGNPSVNGTVRLDEGSNVSVVLPDGGPGANEARKVVTFIDHRDTLALRKYLVPLRRDTTLQRLTFEGLTNSQISLTLEVDDKSELTLVVDELNGDNLRVRGNANLNVSVNASGEVSVLGRYDVTEGEYSLTYQVLRRTFQIQKGGYIQFTGDPLRANLNLTAVYETNAAPAELVRNEVAGNTRSERQDAYRARLPFDVLLTMSGNLAAPKLSFDIQVDENRGRLSAPQVVAQVRAKLNQIRQDPSQMNKQVFGLLLLNSFIADDPSSFFSGGGGGGTIVAAENIARSSVSKLLSQQLERFASNVLKGFDVNFDLQSQNEYQSGTVSGTPIGRRGGRTDLNVGLSKSFLDGRLSVTVGRNFVLENSTGLGRNPQEVFDNVSLQYNLSRDGRYALRGYRQNRFDNQITAVVDGYVIETGVAFVITVDYSYLKELFRKRREEERGVF